MAIGASLRNALTLWRMPSRTTLAVAAVLFFLLVGAWLVAHRAAGLLVDSLRWFGSAQYASASVGLGGTVEYRGFRLVAATPGAPEVFSADTVRLETPGLHWLVWHGLFGSASSGGIADYMGEAALARVQQDGGIPRAFPGAGRLVAIADGVVPGAALGATGDLRWFGLSSGAPMDAEGCDGRRRFEAVDLAQMGLGETPTRIELRFDVVSSDSARIGLVVERPSTSRAELEMTVRGDDIESLPDRDWSQLVILDRRWVVQDQGFVSARNRWCAARMGISRDGFVDRHLAAIKRELASAGAVPTGDLESAYRRYAARGGEITWHSRPTLTTPLGQLGRFTLAERLRIMNATLESVRGRAAAFRFEMVTPVPLPGEGATDALATAVAPVDGTLPPDTAAVPADGAVVAPDATVAGAEPVAAADPAATPTPAADPVSAPGPAPAGSVAATSSQPAPTAPAAPGTVAPTRVAEAPPATVPASAPTRVPEAPPSRVPELPPSRVAESGPANRVPVPASPVPVSPDPKSSVPPLGPVASVIPIPPTGRALVYSDLRGLEGRRIEVESTFGSVRRGTLEKYTDTAITLRLEQRERGLQVTMPQGTVREVRLLDSRPLLDDPPIGG
jgi:hypothetical protein